MWIAEFYTACCTSSNRRRQRTTRFLKQVEDADTVDVLAAVPTKWEPFDTELLAAILATATGALKRELINCQDTLRATGQMLSGRMALWYLLQRFRLEYGHAKQIELSRMFAHKFEGDLELYLDGLDAILLSMHKLSLIHI